MYAPIAESEYSYTPTDGVCDATKEMQKDFQTNGFVVVRNTFSGEEVDRLMESLAGSDEFWKSEFKVEDGDGLHFNQSQWSEVGSDAVGMASRTEKVARVATTLLGQGELYLYSGKVIMKQPKDGGALIWHQDYGSDLHPPLPLLDAVGMASRTEKVARVATTLLGQGELYLYSGKVIMKQPKDGGALIWHQDYGSDLHPPLPLLDAVGMASRTEKVARVATTLLGQGELYLYSGKVIMKQPKDGGALIWHQDYGSDLHPPLPLLDAVGMASRTEKVARVATTLLGQGELYLYSGKVIMKQPKDGGALIWHQDYGSDLHPPLPLLDAVGMASRTEKVARVATTLLGQGELYLYSGKVIMKQPKDGGALIWHQDYGSDLHPPLPLLDAVGMASRTEKVARVATTLLGQGELYLYSGKVIMKQPKDGGALIWHQDYGSDLHPPLPLLDAVGMASRTEKVARVATTLLGQGELYLYSGKVIMKQPKDGGALIWHQDYGSDLHPPLPLLDAVGMASRTEKVARVATTLLGQGELYLYSGKVIMKQPKDGGALIWHQDYGSDLHPPLPLLDAVGMASRTEKVARVATTLLGQGELYLYSGKVIMKQPKDGGALIWHQDYGSDLHPPLPLLDAVGMASRTEKVARVATTLLGQGELYLYSGKVIMKQPKDGGALIWHQDYGSDLHPPLPLLDAVGMASRTEKVARVATTLLGQGELYLYSGKVIMKQPKDGGALIWHQDYGSDLHPPLPLLDAVGMASRTEKVARVATTLLGQGELYLYSGKVIMKQPKDGGALIWHQDYGSDLHPPLPLLDAVGMASRTEKVARVATTLLGQGELYLYSGKAIMKQPKDGGALIWHQDYGSDLHPPLPLLDAVGMASRTEKVARVATTLLGQGELYLYSGKVIMKQPKDGGALIWHQDYGYWYNNGCLFPHFVMCFVALTKNDRENGGLQVLKGSQHCGRLNHWKQAGQTGADLERVAEIEKVLELVPCDLKAGDVIFFHSNMLHRSLANLSEHKRWNLIFSYNAKCNTPVNVAKNYNNNYCEEARVEFAPQDAVMRCSKRGMDKRHYLDPQTNHNITVKQ